MSVRPTSSTSSVASNVAYAAQIPIPAPLRVANLAADWKRFRGQWSNYVTAAALDRESPERQAAMFVACIGADA